MWKIWYGDGTSFGDENGPPEMAPPCNVQVIVQDDERTGRYNQCGSDYYIWRDGRWLGCDIFGLWDYLCQKDRAIVRFGRTLYRDDFQHILTMAEADDTMPRRSGWKSKGMRIDGSSS